MEDGPNFFAVAPKGTHACYLLRCGQLTYNGYTNHLEHRLRQHRGEIKGGAKATTRRGCGTEEWEVVAVVIGDAAFTYRRALSLEWRIRYPTGRRPRPRAFDGPHGRVAGLRLAVAHPKFADLALTVVVAPGFEKKEADGVAPAQAQAPAPWT